MNADELRALQAPLKDSYRNDPAPAKITLRARAELGSENVSCKVEAGRALVEAGLHPATGCTGTARSEVALQGPATPRCAPPCAVPLAATSASTADPKGVTGWELQKLSNQCTASGSSAPPSTLLV